MFRSRILAITLPCLAIFGESTWAQVPRDIATQRVVHDCFGSDPKDHRTCYITQSCGIDSSGKAICLSTESSPSTSENSTAPNRAKAPHSPAGKHNPPPPHQTSPNSNDYSTDAVIAVGTGFALLALFGLVIFGRKRRLQTDTRRKQGQSVQERWKAAEQHRRSSCGQVIEGSRLDLRGLQIGRGKFGARKLELELGGITLPEATESKHFLFSGATGSGKTQGINKLLGTIRERGVKAIIADAGAAAVEVFYQPGDIILNPFDSRSVHWSPFLELATDGHDASAIAKAAIPDAAGDSQEWHAYAQTFLAETILALSKRGVRSVPELLDTLVQSDANTLRLLLSGTPAQILCQEGNEKMLSNTRAIIGLSLVAWKRLKSDASFSVRNWVRDESCRNWLFITYREDQYETLKRFVSTLLDLAIMETLSLPENDKRQIWFVMDEVDSLGKISSLRNGLSKLRKYGGKCILGLQTVAQLRSTYGNHEAQTLMANVATKLVLRAGDGETAEYFSAEFGNQRIERAQLATANSLRGGKSETSTVIQETRRTVLESDIAGLPDLCGYLKSPGFIAPVALEYERLPSATVAFALDDQPGS